MTRPTLDDPASLETLWQALDVELESATDLRHAIHADPRVSGEEGPTAELVVTALGLDGGPDVHGGRIGRIGSPDGPAVALRGELDALPIREETGLPWASATDAMHACGHDIHLAALVAVARAVARAGAPVPLVVVLQPREETQPSGAADLVSTPELAQQDIRAMIGVHVQPRIPAGTFSALPGAVNASADEFTITFEAHGGHAGYPHTTGDPIVAAAHFITQVQSTVARSIDPTHPAVVTVGAIHAGKAPNVIPAAATLRGTIRAFSHEDRAFLQRRVTDIAEATATLQGCVADVVLTEGDPPLINDDTLAHLATRWITDHVDLVESAPLRSCGADDFSFYSEHFPSLMVFHGVGAEDGSGPGLHHPRFAPGDEHIAAVARVMMAGYLAGCDRALGHSHASA